ncbi:hypothetical protein [Vibrio bathopelagicus]
MTKVKPTKDKTLKVRVTQEQLDRYHAQCAERGTTLSKVLRDFIEKEFANV